MLVYDLLNNISCIYVCKISYILIFFRDINKEIKKHNPSIGHHNTNNLHD